MLEHVNVDAVIGFTSFLVLITLHPIKKQRFIPVSFFHGSCIGHFAKYHNNLCLCPQILHKHCFQFLLGLTVVPRENKNNSHAKFGGTNKDYYGISRSGLFVLPLFLPDRILMFTSIDVMWAHLLTGPRDLLVEV